jgi:hypothetical protein
MSMEKDLDEYPTMYHWRNAASHRSTFNESLELFYESLLDLARDTSRQKRFAKIMPNPSGVYAPSPGVNTRASATKKGTPQVQKMPPGRSSLGTTPGKGQSIDMLPREFLERGNRCTGVFIAKRACEPEGERDSSDEEDSDEDGNEDKKSRMRRSCFLCRKLTQYVCHGCGRAFCMEPPQEKFLKKVLAKRNTLTEKEKRREEKEKQMQAKKKGGGKKKGSKKKGKGKGHTKQNNTHKVQMKVKAKYPKLFCVEVPKFKETDKNGNVIFIREYGEYTCYHIAHHEQWKKYLFEREKEAIEQLHEFIEKTHLGRKPIRRER